jgi:hypothetical protein
MESRLRKTSLACEDQQVRVEIVPHHTPGDDTSKRRQTRKMARLWIRVGSEGIAPK